MAGDFSAILQILQSVNQNIGNLNQTLIKYLPNTAYTPFQQTDASASSNSLYYSTTTSKLTYKDPSGTTHTLY